MDVIEEFVSRYVREYDFYEMSSRIAAGMLKADLDATGIRAIVTHRPKAVDRLERKCRQRHIESPYGSVDEIVEDIVDLAGVRVALYFPGERDEVDRAINRLFTPLEPRKDIPGSEDGEKSTDDAGHSKAVASERSNDASTYRKRFPGYTASHYRVRMNDDQLPAAQARYAIARIEIQVASVLMHAWSEVEHDLVYKPLREGDSASDDERALIDQLNGLVHSGEIALERLQKAADRRISQKGRPFRNHYELAAHLIAQFQQTNDRSVGKDGLGRVDELFEYLTRIEIDNPAKLEPFVESLHGNLESRSLSEQIIDATLAADSKRYETMLALRDRDSSSLADSHATHSDFEGDPANFITLVGRFVMRWSELESFVRGFTAPDLARRPFVQIMHDPEVIGALGTPIVQQIDRLRRYRNLIVHGKHAIISPGQARGAIDEIEDVIRLLRELPPR
ncbi:hypothetical protein ACFWM1_32315 [Nocardia sp. NPDC058379]|uniref:hypothetical protein n=1 Tax=unclassified Nocardia TaxID=2637762 RepID=UPI003661556F